MTEDIKNKQDITVNALIEKGNLKQDVFRNTFESFNILKRQAQMFDERWKAEFAASNERVHVEFEEKNHHEFKLKFAGDMLVFLMHTNIFEFPRAHEIMKTSYIKENVNRSYCGIINIYNFLADSFKYNRVNDIGYLIGRIFINIDNHYLIEGKREIGLIANNFAKNVFDEDTASNILDSGMKYCIDFDLLTPPYENMKEITVLDILQTEFQATTISTAKRMGFRFQADKDVIK